MYNNYNSGRSSWLERIPLVTRVMLILNVALWLGTFFSGEIGNLIYAKMGLHYWGSSAFNPLQLVTYQFVHGGFTHMFFNMFALYMFGSLLERVWGTWRYLIFYLICGIGAAVVQELVWSFTWQADYIAALAEQNFIGLEDIRGQVNAEIAAHLPERMMNVDFFQRMLLTVGASGAIFGLLAGFAFVFPNMPMYLFFIPVPIKAKYVVIGYGLLELSFGVVGALSSIAHFAHLGGMLFALVIIWIWHRKGILHGNIY